MEVPSRWFGWCLFFMVLAISQLKKLPKVSYALLVIAAVELTLNLPFGKIFKYTQSPPIANSSFQQHDDFPVPDPSTSNMYEGVISNYGVIPGYEALITRAGLGWARYGIAEGDKLVTDNAKVTYWSPNVIKLKRLAPGAIWLNINPSSYWLVNGQRLFSNDRVAEPGKEFIITNPAQNITLEISPR